MDTEHESNLDLGANNLTNDDVAELNNRPLYGPWTVNYAIRMYFFAWYRRGWMETQPKTEIGRPMPNEIRSKYRGSTEMYQNGFQRAAALNFIIQNGYQPLEFKLWIFKNELDQTTDKYEQFTRKPVVRGGLFTYQGDFYIWVRICYLCQDEDKFTDFTFWIDKGSGPVTPSYQLRAEGRNAVLEYWKLPAGAVGAVSKDVYCQFKDILPAPYQETHTWRGDYRQARITSNPTPPALAS